MTVLELEANTINTWEATILVENLGVFNTRLAELAAKAVKLGVEPIVAVELERSIIKVTREGREIEVPTVTLLLSGSTPVLAGGWKFLGAIEHAVNGVTLVCSLFVNSLRSAITARPSVAATRPSCSSPRLASSCVSAPPA